MNLNKLFKTILASHLAFTMIFGNVLPAIALVWTDKDDYSPGETVTIFGDNSDGAGFISGETIDIVVQTPYGQETGQTVADENGAFSWQFVLPSDDSAVGEYFYTATGRESGVTQSGRFTDGNIKIFSAPSGVTFTLIATKYTSSTNCTTGAGTSTTYNVGSSGGVTIGVGNTESVKLEAVSPSNQGGNFIKWSSSFPFSVIEINSICVQGFTGGGSREYYANYGTPPPPSPQPATGTLIVAKVVKNDNGGTKLCSDFSFLVNSGTPVPFESDCQNDLTVSAGTYNVTEPSVPGYTTTYNNCTNISVPAGGSATCTITNDDIPASISGMKWHDLDADGEKEDGEPGLPNWTIELYNGEEKLIDETTTDENGIYTFTNLSAGDYSVCEVLQTDWYMSYPTDSDCYEVTVEIGENETDVNFGNYQYALISGMKFEDMNGDGEKDNGDTGLNGWTINLSDGEEVLEETTTKTKNDNNNNGYDGYYEFSVKPGTYTICEELKDGWIQTYPFGIYDNSYDCDPRNGYQVTVTSGQVLTDLDFGNFKLGKISGYKFYDIDGDGEWDKDKEPGLSNWTIELYNGTNGPIKTTTTNGNGNGKGYYEFANLGPGTYKVCEVLQTGWSQTTPNGSNGCHEITMTSGLESKDNNFGNQLNICFKGLTPPVSLTLKEFQKLSTIPVKFQLVACEKNNSGWILGDPIPDEIAQLASATLMIKNGTTEVPAVSSGNSNYLNYFRYSVLGDQFIFNLSTKMSIFQKRGTYGLNVYIQDLVVNNLNNPAATITIR